MDTLDILDTAKELNCSDKTVRRLLKKGKLTGTFEGGRWLITYDSVRTYNELHRQVGQGLTTQTPGQVDTGKGELSRQSRDVVELPRAEFEGLLTRLGQLTAQQQYLLEYKNSVADLQTTIKEKEGELKKTKRERVQDIDNRIVFITGQIQELKKIQAETERIVEDREKRIRELQTEVESRTGIKGIIKNIKLLLKKGKRQ